MPITSKFLKDLREGMEADVPTHPSDAAKQIPESSWKKKAKVQENDDKDADELVDENLEADVPTHPSDADNQIPDELKEEDDEEEKVVAESDDADEDDKVVAEEEDEEEKVVAESDDEDEDDMVVAEEEDEEEKVVAESDDADEDDKEMSEEDGEPSEEESKKLEEEDGEDVKDAADALTKDENLPESFKKKVSSIFEAAVKRSVKRRNALNKKKLVENYNKKIKAAKKSVSNSLVSKVDGYLDYVVEEWMKENRVAIEGSLRSEITEKFISGLKNLFESHYIEVPAEKKNILAEQEKKIKKLEKELNEEMNRSVEIRKENVRLKKTSIIKKLTEGMTVSDTTKFIELCEGVTFDSTPSFSQKLKVIKETYFPKVAKKGRDIDASLLTEGGLKHQETQPTQKTEVDVFADAISRLVKR